MRTNFDLSKNEESYFKVQQLVAQIPRGHITHLMDKVPNALEHEFTKELGGANDYERTYGDTPFGLLVRKLVKLDHYVAFEAFAQFINSQALNEQQISFVHKVVDYVVENGYIELDALAQPPFDRPQSFVRMFNTQQQRDLIAIINAIKHNAEHPAA